METYDKKKIGKCISWGSDHTVYHYGDDKVIKFSVSDFLLGTRNKTTHDYSTCKSFYGEYILETEFVNSPNRRYFASVQRRITGRYLTKKDLTQDAIKKQFAEIVEIYEQMKKSGAGEIDLVGSGGILRFCLSNVFVIEDSRLVILDSSTFTIRGHYLHPLRYIFLGIICPLSLVRQHAILRSFKKLL